MPRKAVGEGADHDERKACHNGFKVGKVHWCYPFFPHKDVVDQIRVSSSAHVLHACAMKISKRWAEDFSSGTAPRRLFPTTPVVGSSKLGPPARPRLLSCIDKRQVSAVVVDQLW